MKDKNNTPEELNQHIIDMAAGLGLHFAPEIEEGIFEAFTDACCMYSESSVDLFPESDAEESSDFSLDEEVASIASRDVDKRHKPAQAPGNLSFRKIELEDDGRTKVLGSDIPAAPVAHSRPILRKPRISRNRMVMESIAERQRLSSNPMAMESASAIHPFKKFPPEVEEKLNMLIKQLLDEGIGLMQIHNWLDSYVTLSRLVIKKRYRIVLEDFNRVEIKMAPLPKTIFLFYLRHPEGVAFTELQDYREELISIYSRLSHFDDRSKVEKSIDRLIDPFDNSISEKCSVAKAAFMLKVDPSIAQYYAISGEPGEKKYIPLDRDLVSWEI